MRKDLFLCLLIICLLPVHAAVAAPALPPSWLGQADAYVHYTLGGSSRELSPDSESYGTYSLAVTPEWNYHLSINNNQNPDYVYPPEGNEGIYLWVEYTYYKPVETTGGTSASHPGGNTVGNNLNLSEYRVKTDLTYDPYGGPIFESNAGEAWVSGHKTWGYLFKINPGMGLGNLGWSWENTVDWYTDDDIYMSSLYAAVISLDGESAVPVPGSLLLLFSGMISLAGIRRRIS